MTRAEWAEAGLAVVRCAAGGLNFALEADKVQAMHADVAQPAITLAALLQLPERQPAAQERLLSITHPDGIRLLRVEEPVIRCRVPALTLSPIPPLMAAHLRLPWVRALAWLGTPPDAALLILLDAWRLPTGRS